MTASKKQAVEDLARAGIFVDAPTVGAPVLDSIETVADTDLAELARQEKFMNELLTIRLSTTTDPNAPPFALLTINDVRNRVAIPRGVPVPVKRMHVEVLARMRETRYTQPTRNPMDPEPGNMLVAHNAQVYPFEVIADPSPAGRAWFEALMAEPTY